MRTFFVLNILFLTSLVPAVVRAQNSASPETASAATPPPAATIDQMRQEIETLKKTLGSLEQRLSEQEKHGQAPKQHSAPAEQLTADVKELDHRVSTAERNQALDRLRITGDFRFEAHS